MRGPLRMMARTAVLGEVSLFANKVATMVLPPVNVLFFFNLKEILKSVKLFLVE